MNNNEPPDKGCIGCLGIIFLVIICIMIYSCSTSKPYKRQTQQEFEQKQLNNELRQRESERWKRR